MYDNKINTDFWQSIYKNASEYNAFYISGWIVKFFPYKKTMEFTQTYVEDKGTKVIEKYTLNEFMEGNKYMKSTLSTDDFPTGVSKIDLTWKDFYKNKSNELIVFGGFLAIRQYTDLALEPLISWAICNKKNKSNKHALVSNKSIELIHNKDYWSPNFSKKLTNKAIYDIKSFDSQEKSILFIKTLIEDSLSKSSSFKEFSNSKIQIEFSVYNNGSIDDFVVNKNKNMNLTNYIANLILSLPKPWYPALAHPTDVLMIIDADEKESQIKVKANSKINFNLY